MCPYTEGTREDINITNNINEGERIVEKPSKVEPLDASKVVIYESKIAQTSIPIPNENIKFGHTYTDYMLNVQWTKQHGWHSPYITPFGNISIHPAASGLHYGLQVFEGMKAFKGEDGDVYLFRPNMNMKRLNKSCERLCLPKFDENELLKLIKKLVKFDQKHVPFSQTPGFSLYIRPYVYSTHNHLGVHASESANLSVIMCPAGSYFDTSEDKVKISAITNYARSFPGSAGDSKVGGNYAPTVKPTEEAFEQGFSQILWLHEENGDFVVTEAGTMNFFFSWKNEEGKVELVTPKLENNLILPGITRMSLIELASQCDDVIVKERRIYMKEDVVKIFNEGRMIEMFGAGTAAAVTPVHTITFEGVNYTTPYYREYGMPGYGPLGSKLCKQMFDIQYGKVKHPWCVSINE